MSVLNNLKSMAAPTPIKPGSALTDEPEIPRESSALDGAIDSLDDAIEILKSRLFSSGVTRPDDQVYAVRGETEISPTGCKTMFGARIEGQRSRVESIEARVRELTRLLEI